RAPADATGARGSFPVATLERCPAGKARRRHAKITAAGGAYAPVPRRSLRRPERACSAQFYMTRKSAPEVATIPVSIYDPRCCRCGRLARFLDRVKAEYPEYHCRPVAPFGASDASLLVVGLAPGMHGANATGRPFTGDYAGELLYATLFKFGYATRPRSLSASDGLRLLDARITNAVKCLPPGNLPLGSEVRNCNRYLEAELATLPASASI